MEATQGQHRCAHIMVKEYPSTEMVQFLPLKVLKRLLSDSALFWSVSKINGTHFC